MSHPYSIIVFLALSLVACFSSHQVAARHLLQNNLPDPSTKVEQPAVPSPSIDKPTESMAFPAFHKPLLPPHFLPLYPFPNLPTYPSMPTIPSTVPTGPSVPSIPGTGPNPGTPSVPPSYPNPPAKMMPQNPTTMIPGTDETLKP